MSASPTILRIAVRCPPICVLKSRPSSRTETSPSSVQLSVASLLPCGNLRLVRSSGNTDKNPRHLQEDFSEGSAPKLWYQQRRAHKQCTCALGYTYVRPNYFASQLHPEEPLRIERRRHLDRPVRVEVFVADHVRLYHLHVGPLLFRWITAEATTPSRWTRQNLFVISIGCGCDSSFLSTALAGRVKSSFLSSVRPANSRERRGCPAQGRA